MENAKKTAQSLRLAIRHDTFIEPELVLVGAGEFLMGSAQDDPYADESEKPQHTLYLPEFWIGRYLVTNEEYRLFLAENPEFDEPYGWRDRNYPTDEEDHPITDVCWYYAQAYCHWLSLMTRVRYSLPSEAEWEKAARDTDGRIYPWGNNWEPKCCNSWEENIMSTTPVWEYSPNGDSPYSCTDMAGNVFEWTSSRWGSTYEHLRFIYPYTANDGREDIISSDLRVLRGGAFHRDREGMRCALRHRGEPDGTYSDVGFRVVASPVHLRALVL